MENDNQIDIELNDYDAETLQGILKEYISNDACNVIFAVTDKNLEMAKDDVEFYECLQKADLLINSSNLKSEDSIQSNEAGFDVNIINQITSDEEIDTLSIMLLTDESEFSESFDNKINEVFKDNEYAEYVGSYVVDDETDDDLIINEINGRIPDVLVCICESPVQEKWIIDNKSKIGVKLILALGGEKEEFMQKKENGIKFLAKMFARQRFFSLIL